MKKNLPARRKSATEKQKVQRRNNLIQALFHLPPRTWSLLEIVVLVLLTNHTAVTDFMQLVKVIKS